MKQNEANTAQLQRWQGEYKRMVERYRQKETEVQQLTVTLKQVQAERIRYQKEVAKKARAAQLEAKKRELEEIRQRQRDRKEAEKLEHQIQQLEVQLRRERGDIGWVVLYTDRVERTKRQHPSPMKESERVVTGNDRNLEKQVNGILRRELADRRVKREMVCLVEMK